MAADREREENAIMLVLAGMRRAAWVWLGATAFVVGGPFGCEGEPVEQCFIAGDEDGNGLPDCLDPVCWRVNGPCSESCETSNDEDADGDVGCEDSDCWLADGDCPQVCDSSDDQDADAVGIVSG